MKELPLSWLIIGLIAIFTIRGIYRRIRYAYLIHKRARRIHGRPIILKPATGRNVKVLDYIQINGEA